MELAVTIILFTLFGVTTVWDIIVYHRTTSQQIALTEKYMRALVAAISTDVSEKTLKQIERILDE